MRLRYGSRRRLGYRRPSIPLRQEEPRQFVRVGREVELLREGVGRYVGVHRHPVGLLDDALDRLRVGDAADLLFVGRAAFLDPLLHRRIARVVLVPVDEILGQDRRHVVDRVAAPAAEIERHLTLLRALGAGGHLHTGEPCPDADGLQIALDRGFPLRKDVADEFGVEAVGVAGFRQQRLGLGRIVVVLDGRIGVAAELRRIAGRQRHAAAAGDELVGDRLPVDGMEDGLPHLQLGQRVVRAGAAGRVDLQVADPHRFLACRLQERDLVDVGHLVRIDIPDPVHLLRQQLGQFGCGFAQMARGDLLDRGLALGTVVIVVEPLELDGHRRLVLGDLVGAGADREPSHSRRPRPSRDRPSARSAPPVRRIPALPGSASSS